MAVPPREFPNGGFGCMLLEPIEPPERQARLRINHHATWYSWSAAFRKLSKRWTQEVARLPRPRVIRVAGKPPYNKTFSLGGMRLRDAGLARDLGSLIRGVYEMETPGRILLLSNLLSDELSAHDIHHLLAYVRDVLAGLTGAPNALYAPLGAVGKAQGAFPLHADLYVPQLLWNVFDDVRSDPSGRSLFLGVAGLRAVLDDVPSVPPAVRAQIEAHLCTEAGTDRYADFFDLLYGPPTRWRRQVQRAMDAAALRIKLFRGQGYLIHDRSWLHGREAPRGGVSAQRVHRLVFNTRALAWRRRRASLRSVGPPTASEYGGPPRVG